MTLDSKINADGTCTYWSVYQQEWVTAATIPDRELAAMSPEERKRVLVAITTLDRHSIHHATVWTADGQAGLCWNFADSDDLGVTFLDLEGVPIRSLDCSAAERETLIAAAAAALDAEHNGLPKVTFKVCRGVWIQPAAEVIEYSAKFGGTDDCDYSTSPHWLTTDDGKSEPVETWAEVLPLLID